MRARSFLYVPADQDRMLARAATRGADAIILDLEDAVAEQHKDEAAAAALAVVRGGRSLGESPHGVSPQLWVRVNGGPRGLDELRALSDAARAAGGPGLAGAWLPKTEPGKWLDAALDILDLARVRAGLLIESARGLARLAGLPELREDTLLQLGEVDLAASLRLRSSGPARSLHRALLVLECAARGLPQPVGPVSIDIDAPDAIASTTGLRELGFGARACIHPAQVAIANEVFTVTDAERAEARATLDEFAEAQDAGRGAYAGADGGLVDLATVRWARTVLGDDR